MGTTGICSWVLGHEEQAEFVYKCTDYYNPGDEYSLLWNDETVGIDWPLQDFKVNLSKDQQGLIFQAAPKFSSKAPLSSNL